MQSAAGEGIGVSYDVSAAGVRVSCSHALEVGADVTVSIEVPGASPVVREVRGRVIRIGPNEDDPEGLWPHRVAVEFDERIEGLEALLDASPASVPR
jgi:hypothetical protein